MSALKPINEVIEGMTPPAVQEAAGFNDPAPEIIVAPEPAQQVNVFENERGGVAWVDLYGAWKEKETGIVHLTNKISLTERGENSEAALRGLIRTLAIARDEFHLFPWVPDQPHAPAKVQAPATNPDPEGLPVRTVPAPVAPGQAVPPPAPRTPTPAAPAAPTSPATTGGVLKVCKIDVKPRTDGKVTVDIWGIGRKFADLHMTNTPEVLAQQFGEGWQVEHFSVGVPTSYPISLKVTWAQGKPNTAGGFYKDVTLIEPA